MITNSAWQSLVISDLGKVVTGKTPPTSTPEFFGGEIPFVTPTDMDDRRIISKTERYLTLKGAKAVKGSCLPIRSVMVSCIGSQMGKVAIAGKPCVTNQQINSIVVSPEYSELYVYYCLLLKGEEIKSLGAGSAVPILNKSDFSKLSVTVPPLTEQRAIAGILGALDDKIELNRRMNRTLESMARAVFRQWFIESEEVRGWKVGKLGDLCESTIGGDWGEEKEFEDSLPIICLRGVDLDNLRNGGYSEDAPVRWVKKSSLEKRQLSDRDILIAGSGIGPVGKPLWVSPEMVKAYSFPVIYSNFVKRFRAKTPEYAVYVDRVLFNMRESDAIWDYVNGTSIPNLNDKDLLDYADVIIPPEDKVKTFYEFIKPIYAKLYNKESRTLANLRDRLLPKLMRGEIGFIE